MRAENKSKRAMRTLIYHVIVMGLSFVMLYPLIWMLFSAFKPHDEVFSLGARILPKTWVFTNFADGWKGFANITFTTFYRNSFFVAIMATVGAVTSSAVVAYGFARIKFRFRGLWFVCMMLTMMLPHQVTMVPQYIIFNKLGWVNTFLPLIVPSYFTNAFFVFLMIQFINGLPKELDESATIDGCSRFGIFGRIILPLIMPALATSMVFSFIWSWDNFFGALLYLDKPKLFTISMALRMYSDPTSLTNWGAMFAMSIVSLVPVFTIFISCQRFLVEGISTTGMKA